ncbi:hypothetical protein LshimejAT787_2400150 [Lyophyllum shimeji]|uniref:Uncharacterized protein n=1 Tax=Lyophyllum shimeji TaxID=47721 RepID=A0A9P3Q2D7_LYOSH|nr:hypothetical protein LshimejAT787_2400150 [Lyophyllum shimeji]
MDTGINYDALRNLHESKSTQPKLFSLTQSMPQLENLNGSQKYNRVNVGCFDTPGPFRPYRSHGGDPASKRPPLFPALQRFQKPQEQNQAQKYQQPQKAPYRPPFFGLLKPPSEASAPEPSRYPAVFRQGIVTFTSTSHVVGGAHIASHDGHPQPLQILQPPPPPTAPISRPSSPARPRPRPHSRSRSRSTTSYRQEERPNEFDAGFDGSPPARLISQSTDLPDIAIKALREVRSVNAELTEERRRSKILISQLNTLTAAHETLKLQHSSVQQELLSARRQSEECAEAVASTKNDLSIALTSLASATQELDALGESYASLRSSFGELKNAYDASQALVLDLREARQVAADGLKTIEPLLNDEGQYAHGTSVKVVVGELQDEIADSQRVIDLLRDKLHHVSSQLAEAQGRVRELEEYERVALRRWRTRWRTLLGRLLERERETIGVLAEAAALKAKLGVAHTQIDALETELKTLRDCKDAKCILELRVDELMQKIKGLEESLNTTAEAGRKVVKAAEDARRKRRLTKDQCGDLQERLLASEEALKRKSEEVEALTKEGLERMDELRRMEVHSTKLQEHLEAQKVYAGAGRFEEDERITPDGGALNDTSSAVRIRGCRLKSTKDDVVDLQKRLEASEAALERKDQVLKELNAERSKRMDETREMAICFAKLQEQFDARAAVLEEKEQCCQELQKVNSDLKAELAASQTTLEAARQDLLTERAALVAASLDYALKLAGHEEAKAGGFGRQTERKQVEDGRVEALEKQLEALKAENCALQEKAREQEGLRARYELGTLMDDEKDFVEWLIKLSSELHEQEDVIKDNELRRRENMIVKLQGKVRELESALARLLKEKQKEAGVPSHSMVDLNAWMTSSPTGPGIDPAVTIVAPGYDYLSPLCLPESRCFGSSPNAKTARVVSKKTEATEPTFGALNSFSSLDESDSDEDIPLSELSATMHTSASASVLGKRERAASPPKIVAKTGPKKTGAANAKGRRLVASFRLPRSLSEIRVQELSHPPRRTHPSLNERLRT